MSCSVTALGFRSNDIQLFSSPGVGDEGRISMINFWMRLRLLVMLHMTRTEVGEGEVTSVMVGATGRSTGENGKLKKKISVLVQTRS